MRKRYDFSFLMLYCDNSGLLDATELSNGNRQGNSPNMCLTQNVGIFWVVLECYYQWRSLPAKFILALQLLVSIGRQSSESDVMGSSHYQQPAYCVYLNRLRQIVFRNVATCQSLGNITSMN